MRKISTGDVFKMARIMRDGNIVQSIKAAYAEGKAEGADSEEIGIKVATDILCSCTDGTIEGQFYELMAGICEKKPEDIKDQSLEVTIGDIKRIIKENNIINFWKSASSLSGNI